MKMSGKSIYNDNTPGSPIRAYDSSGNFKDFGTDDLVGEGKNNFLGWKCSAGVFNLYVNMDGEMYRATCHQGGRLGNVFEDFSLSERWVKCGVNFCTCGADLFIPKAQDESAMHRLHKLLQIYSDPSRRRPMLSNIVAVERTHKTTHKQVHWEIGRRCNFDCSYCAKHIHNKTDRHKTLEELKSATDKIHLKFGRGFKLLFIISGGEPTINPDFVSWLEYIKSLGHEISLHSNGSRLPEYYRQLIKFGDMNLSAHFEFLNVEKFFSVVKTVTEEKINLDRCQQSAGHLEVKLMMTPDSRRNAVELYLKILEIPGFKEYCTMAFVPVRGGELLDELLPGYTDKDHLLFGVPNQDLVLSIYNDYLKSSTEGHSDRILVSPEV